MKRLFAGIFAVLTIAAIAHAWMVPTYQKPTPYESALTYNNTYPIQTNNSHIDTLSFQCITTSATIKATTFTDAMITPGSAVISATNTFTTPNAYAGQNGAVGFEMWLSRSGSFTPAPLAVGTTYYVIPLTVNTFELATTSTGAIAGVPIVLTSSGSANTYTLNPEAISGTPSYKWQESNDGVNYNDITTTPFNISITSVTIGTYASTGTLNSWDFGPYDYPWIRLNVIAPTQGGINIKCTPNGEGQGGSGN